MTQKQRSTLMMKKYALEEEKINLEAKVVPATNGDRDITQTNIAKKVNKLEGQIAYCEEQLLNDEEFLFTFDKN